MPYASADELRDALAGCASQVTFPTNGLGEVNTRARRLVRRRRATAAAATGAAVGVGLVSVPVLRSNDRTPAPTGVAASTAAATQTPTPEPTSAGPSGGWPCGTTGFDRALVRSAHGAATPQAALLALGYGTGRLSSPVTLRPGTVELREFDRVTGALAGVYTLDQLDDGSWGVHSAQRPAPCK